MNKTLKNIKEKFNRKIFSNKLLNLKHRFVTNSETRELIDSGIFISKKKFLIDKIDFNKYLSDTNFEFVSKRFKLNEDDLKKIIIILNELGILKIIKNYLGKKLVIYNNSILTLGKIKSNDKSMMPHHDKNGRCIKVYIWIDKFSLNSHPLYYLEKSHTHFRRDEDYESSRFGFINKIKFKKYHGGMGDVILFDTNGIHSHFKDTVDPRSVVEINFEPYGFLSRMNNLTFDKFKNRIDFTFLENYL